MQRAQNLAEERCEPKPIVLPRRATNCQMLFCRLTPELSRPVAGRRTRASVAHSTWPTPRHGVGLNDLLGGPEPRDAGLRPRRPKAEARPLERASRTYSRPHPKQRGRRGRPIRRRTSFPKQTNATHATCERVSRSSRRDNVPANCPKSMPTEAGELAGTSN